MDDVLIENLIELSSWRIASSLVKRHPKSITACIIHPGGGQNNVLWLIDREYQSPQHGDIMLNRSGTISIGKRFDGNEIRNASWFNWGHYFSEDHKHFMQQLENAAGLPNVKQSPSTTNRVLVYQLFVHLLRNGFVNAYPLGNHRVTYTIKNGYFDSSGYAGSSRNVDVDSFKFDKELLRPREYDLYNNPLYRFWILYRVDHKNDTHIPVAGFEESSAGMVISGSEDVINLMSVYNENARNIVRFFNAVSELSDSGVFKLLTK